MPIKKWTDVLLEMEQEERKESDLRVKKAITALRKMVGHELTLKELNFFSEILNERRLTRSKQGYKDIPNDGDSTKTTAGK